MPRTAIEHIDASNMPSALRRDEAETLIVFWLNDVPVGQVRDHGIAGKFIDIHGYWRELSSTPAFHRATEIAKRQGKPACEASLVICTRDRPDELHRCLASLPAQSYPPAEVIVVDNASRDDRTRKVAEAAGAIYVREDRPGLDIARNSGIRRATAPVVAFTDDDVHLHPRWLERLVLALEDNGAMAVTGLVLPAELETEAQQIFETYWSFGQGYEPQTFGSDFFAADGSTGSEVWKIGAGANMAFRREVFQTAGLFDERLDVGAAGCSGDSEYWHRVLSTGGTCFYEPTAVAFHYHRREIDGLASQIYHYMRGHAAALMVQYERTHNRGNLWRAFNLMPRYYAKRLWQRYRYGERPHNRFINKEVAGFIAGLFYYARNSRSDAR